MTRIFLVINFLIFGVNAFGISGTTALDGYSNVVQNSINMDRFTDNLENVNVMNGKVQDCNPERWKVNQKTLYDSSKDSVPQSKLMCVVTGKDILNEVAKRKFLQFEIPNNEVLQNAPDSVKQLFPNGVPPGGKKIIVEQSEDAGMTKFSLTAFNDNFGPTLGDDKGMTAKQVLSVQHTFQNNWTIGMEGSAALFTQDNYYARRADGKPHQFFADDVAIKFFAETPGIKVSGLTFKGKGSIGWREVSTDKKRGFLYGSRTQAEFHNFLKKTGIDNNAPNYKYDETKLLTVNKDGDLKFSDDISGLEIGFALAVAKHLKFKNGCYIKMEVEAGFTASQLKYASHVDASASLEAGYKFSSGRVIYTKVGMEISKYDQQELNDGTRTTTSLEIGARGKSFGCKYAVMNTTGAVLGYVPYDDRGFS